MIFPRTRCFLKIIVPLLIVLITIIPTATSIHLKNTKNTNSRSGKNIHIQSALKSGSSNENILEQGLLIDQNEKITLQEAQENIPVIAYYFASSSCPACHKFTPYLRKLYEEWNKSTKLIEIIWIQVGDSSQRAWEEFYSDMPWLALPRNDPRSFLLEQKYQLESVPDLVIVSKKGETLEREAYHDVVINGKEAIAKWLDISLESL